MTKGFLSSTETLIQQAFQQTRRIGVTEFAPLSKWSNWHQIVSSNLLNLSFHRNLKNLSLQKASVLPG